MIRKTILVISLVSMSSMQAATPAPAVVQWCKDQLTSAHTFTNAHSKAVSVAIPMIALAVYYLANYGWSLKGFQQPTTSANTQEAVEADYPALGAAANDMPVSSSSSPAPLSSVPAASAPSYAPEPAHTADFSDISFDLHQALN